MGDWIKGLVLGVSPFWAPWLVFALLLLSGFGIALGEEIIIIPAGMWLHAHGGSSWWPVILASYAGVVVGDILWFLICSTFGNRLLHKKWFKRIAHPKRMLQVKYQFDVRGVWVVVLARFIPGSRTTTITVAGLMHMKFWKFTLATAICCLLTTPAQLFAGWWIAKTFEESKTTVETITKLLALVVVVLAFVLAYRLWAKHRKSGERIPRARASWLQHFPPKKK